MCVCVCERERERERERHLPKGNGALRATLWGTNLLKISTHCFIRVTMVPVPLVSVCVCLCVCVCVGVLARPEG